MLAWTDPPLKDRIGTVDGDFAIAYLSESESGAERAGVVRRHTLLEAREAALSLIKSGHQVRIFNKEGTIVY